MNEHPARIGKTAQSQNIYTLFEALTHISHSSATICVTKIQLTADAFRNEILFSTIYININAKHGSVWFLDAVQMPNGATRWTSALVLSMLVFECVLFWLVNFDKRKVFFLSLQFKPYFGNVCDCSTSKVHRIWTSHFYPFSVFKQLLLDSTACSCAFCVLYILHLHRC